MLGRHANSLYWISRYFERVENIVRKLQTVIYINLTKKDFLINEILNDTSEINEKDNFININDIESSINSILRNRSNQKSIISLIKNVRNNSKIVRNSLTRETWQSINECWIKFDKVSKNKIHFQKIPEVLENLLKDYLIFRGTVYSTLLRNDVYYFLEIGMFLERIENTTRVIRSNTEKTTFDVNIQKINFNELESEILLRTLASWNSFNWLYNNNICEKYVLDYLLKDQISTRSLNFCYNELDNLTSKLCLLYNKKNIFSKNLKNRIFFINENRNRFNDKIVFKNFIRDSTRIHHEFNETLTEYFNFI
tara:strand:- start:434 stop:1363 length:930 start_codon:yes stop_codon:yes gene_type:complete